MAKVHYLKDYLRQTEEKHPRSITFHSALLREGNKQTSFTITVSVQDGDWGGILKTVVELGGIGQEDEHGVYRFIPWPCAGLSVRDS
jgi:hypothetical protein